jgi:hypothetical protein
VTRSQPVTTAAAVDDPSILLQPFSRPQSMEVFLRRAKYRAPCIRVKKKLAWDLTDTARIRRYKPFYGHQSRFRDIHPKAQENPSDSVPTFARSSFGDGRTARRNLPLDEGHLDPLRQTLIAQFMREPAMLH